MESYIADIINDLNTKTDATRLKKRKIKRYALENENCLQYAFGVIVILVTTILVTFGLIRFTR